MDITVFLIVRRDVLEIHIQYMFSIRVQCLSLREPPQYWTTTTVDLLCCLSSTWRLTLISAPASPCGPVNNHTRQADQLSCTTSLCQVKTCERQKMRYLTLPVCCSGSGPAAALGGFAAALCIHSAVRPFQQWYYMITCDQLTIDPKYPHLTVQLRGCVNVQPMKHLVLN